MKSTSSKSLPKDEATQLNALLKHLSQLPEAVEFVKPVDYKGLGLDDYPQVIKQPMDLNSVRKKLKGNKYQSLQEAVADIQLIWDNCKLYNVQDSPIVRQAYLMEKSMNAYLAQNVASNSPRKRSREDALEPRPFDHITYEDKIELSEKVRRVSHETLAKIVQIVQADCPAAYEELDNDRVQVKVDALDLSTFNKINELAFTFNRPEEPRSSPAKKPKKS
mmetsp:Transcript_4946/g.9280  ORF Transcript_4946/g.9280 Transcript_4946/m.9280 type:complete len:220 (+) Transcript_4946:863-1522(+)